MTEIDPLLLKIDKLISLSRLQEMAFILSIDLRARIIKMSEVLKQLRSGAYLLGTGPSTVGMIPLTVDEIVLGRSATVLESPQDTVIDYEVADTIYFIPREVSRAHAKIIRHINDLETEYTVVDLQSTCGTYLNGKRIKIDQNGSLLSHGDIISLGPSQINTYMFYVVGDTIQKIE